MGPIVVGDGAGTVALVTSGLDLALVLTVGDTQHALLSIFAEADASIELRADGTGALVVQFGDFGPAVGLQTRAWRYRWDAARRTLVPDGMAWHGVHEKLPAWVPDDVRANHDAVLGLRADEQLCAPYAPSVSNVALVADGVLAMLVCDRAKQTARVVVRRDRERLDLDELAYVRAELGIVAHPRGGALVVEVRTPDEGVEQLRLIHLRWSARTGMTSSVHAPRSRRDASAFVRRVLP